MEQTAHTLSSLQAYITELTVYINENNETYTNNLETLKQFYESQIDELSESSKDKEDEIIDLRNQLYSLKDLLLNSKRCESQLKDTVNELKNDIKELEEQIVREKQRNKQAYEHIDQLREDYENKLKTKKMEIEQIQQEKGQLSIGLREKEVQAVTLCNQIKDLQKQVADRYSLPERMKEMEMREVQLKTNLSNLQAKAEELQQDRDFKEVELSKRNKEAEKLKVTAEKAKGDLSYEVETAVRKEKQKLLSEIQRYKLDSERKIFELKDLENKIKQQARQLAKLQKIANNSKKVHEEYIKEIAELKADKDVYLAEFRNLKSEYEAVISSLESAIPEYQTKNWGLQQENQQLNEQLTGLHDLLREVKAMNDLEPLKKQYRQWAELNLQAMKKLPTQQAAVKEPQQSSQDGLSTNWDKLLSQINSIQVWNSSV